MVSILRFPLRSHAGSRRDCRIRDRAEPPRERRLDRSRPLCLRAARRSAAALPGRPGPRPARTPAVRAARRGGRGEGAGGPGDRPRRRRRGPCRGQRALRPPGRGRPRRSSCRSGDPGRHHGPAVRPRGGSAVHPDQGRGLCPLGRSPDAPRPARRAPVLDGVRGPRLRGGGPRLVSAGGSGSAHPGRGSGAARAGRRPPPRTRGRRPAGQGPGRGAERRLPPPAGRLPEGPGAGSLLHGVLRAAHGAVSRRSLPAARRLAAPRAERGVGAGAAPADRTAA